MKKIKIILLILITVFTTSVQAEGKELKLLGFDKMIKDVDAVVVTDKTYFKRRLKNGAPKYLHQIKDEFYYMQVTPSGHYNLDLNPAEWFDIERIENDKFKVRIIEPMQMFFRHQNDEFSIKFKIDEVIYCDECDNGQYTSKYKSEPGMHNIAPPFKLLGFEKMMKEFYGAVDSDGIDIQTQTQTRKKHGRPKYLHQIKNEVYTLMVSVPGDYVLKLKPESWFDIKQIKGDVFQVQFVDPANDRRLKMENGFTVDWHLDEID